MPASIPWNMIDRWQDGKIPPHYNLYTLFQLKFYFLAFFVISILHTYIMYGIKHQFSVAFRNLTFLERIIHAYENTHIPFNTEEWDTLKANFKILLIMKYAQINIADLYLSIKHHFEK